MSLFLYNGFSFIASGSPQRVPSSSTGSLWLVIQQEICYIFEQLLQFVTWLLSQTLLVFCPECVLNVPRATGGQGPCCFPSGPQQQPPSSPSCCKLQVTPAPSHPPLEASPHPGEGRDFCALEVPPPHPWNDLQQHICTPWDTLERSVKGASSPLLLTPA